MPLRLKHKQESVDDVPLHANMEPNPRSLCVLLESITRDKWRTTGRSTPGLRRLWVY